MSCYSAVRCSFGRPNCPGSRGCSLVTTRFLICGLASLAIFWAFPVPALILWNDPGPALVHETGSGNDILAGAVKKDETSSDTLYFKFHVDPLSDETTEEYFAAFELYEGHAERLGVGNALKAWAYSAFVNSDETGESNNVAGYIDLHSARPETFRSESALTYELPRK